MINITKQSDKESYKVIEYVADTTSDINDLPTDMSKVSAGSTCFVIEDSSVYMLNSQGEWKQI
jgi:hypothetical protein